MVTEEEEETMNNITISKEEYLVNYLRLRISELFQRSSISSSTTTSFPLLVSADCLLEKNNLLSFTDYSNNKSYYLHLPETKNMRFCGSSEGWLIMVTNTVGLARIFLFQPFSKAYIELPQGSNSPIIPERYSSRLPPPPPTDHRPAATAPYFIRKAILSSSPSVSNQDWAVAAIDSSVLHPSTSLSSLVRVWKKKKKKKKKKKGSLASCRNPKKFEEENVGFFEFGLLSFEIDMEFLVKL